MMKCQSNKEKAATLMLVWELSFNHENKQMFMDDTYFWKRIQGLRNDGDDEVSKAAQLACIVISDGTVAGDPRREERILISHAGKDNKMLAKVRDNLQAAGYKVWMDVDNMEGDILDAMARAVEDAHIVLMCYSEKYKESKNCRTEAQYAYQVNKEIIPILMQNRYKPDGWLGILVGSKDSKVPEFTDERNFDENMTELMQEVESRFRIMFKKGPKMALREKAGFVLNKTD